MLETIISFGNFQLISDRQELTENGRPVRLGSRAISILTILVRRAGELVTNEEIVREVWPETFVEEGNLRVHMTALRRALGHGRDGTRYIVNVPGRGYRFVRPVTVTACMPSVGSSTELALPHASLPTPMTRMIGRDDLVTALKAQIPQRRLITLVGPGGIGKTTVARSVAQSVARDYRHGSHFVELATITDGHRVPGAVATALGFAVKSDDPSSSLISHLGSLRAMIVLDNCEHLVEAVATLAEDLLLHAPGVQLLVTSREALRVDGERVVRVAPLSVPPPSDGLTAQGAATYSAIQLFVEHASSNLDLFELTDVNAPAIADICRRLDGIPLAIEMAAGRIESLGPSEIAAMLDDRFRFLNKGRRTAPPRHRTLRSIVDWSYNLLPEGQRRTFRYLSVFAGWFSAPAAAAIIADEATTLGEIVNAISDLTSKSLLAVDVSGNTTLYRFFETTRAYALELLSDAGESEAVGRAHAVYVCERFERAKTEWDIRPTAEWLAEYRLSLDDLRAALDWAFAPGGDLNLAVRLTLAAAPMWLELSLIEECRKRTEQALAAVGHESDEDDERTMQLYAALAWSQLYQAEAAHAAAASWTKVLEIAEALGDLEFQLRAHFGLWANSINRGLFGRSLAQAEHFAMVAARKGDQAEILLGERLLGASLHLKGGAQSTARSHLEHMLSGYNAPIRRSHAVRFQVDQRITARMTLARTLWLQGMVDQAMQGVERLVEDAWALGHMRTLCNVLAQVAAPLALWTGDETAAERYTRLLLDATSHEALEVWRAYGFAFQGHLMVARGDVCDGIDLLRASIEQLERHEFVQLNPILTGNLADFCAEGGRLVEARDLIEKAIAFCERTEGRWCIAELWRVRGNIAVLEAGDVSAPAAARDFRQSLDFARQQGAFTWTLRTSMSIARSYRAQGRFHDALDILQPVYDSFSEGFRYVDLRAARHLLRDLSHAVGPSSASGTNPPP
ncbi:ATP-binding protein [Salinarimonas soli]|uniref:ATP-binding protein n=1 Tax=Salinarimonas soli TaxID=1638099 RepID=UPI0016621BB5|nr:winged helix-turn-helix domain-containing protein [Salinarimonas soli]